MDYYEYIISEKLAGLHTAYIGSVISVNADDHTAKVQPLLYNKTMGGELCSLPLVTARIAANAKFKAQEITYITSATSTDSGIKTTKETKTILVPDDIAIGDIVVCVVSERDISDDTILGKITKPTRLHDISDSIIVGVIEAGQ